MLRMTDEGPIPTDYKDTEPFQLTQSFLEDPDRHFRYLFEDS